MEKTITLFLAIFFTHFFAVAQTGSSQAILKESIKKRDALKSFMVELNYRYLSAGEVKYKEGKKIIAQIKGDSFLMRGRSSDGIFGTFIIDVSDTFHLITVNYQDSSYTSSNLPINPYSRNLGKKSNPVKEFLGFILFFDDFDNSEKSPKDTVISDIPCWVLNEYVEPNTEIGTTKLEYYISKKDTFYRGFLHEFVIEGRDTFIRSSFIIKIYTDSNNINRVASEFYFDMERIKRSLELKLLQNNSLDPAKRKSEIKFIKGYNLALKDTFRIDLSKGIFLLDYWFIGCYPCVISFPYIDILEKKYAKDGVTFIKLNSTDTDIEKVEKYRNKHSLGANCYLVHKELNEQFGVDSYPTFILIKDGKIIESYSGFNDYRYNQLDKILNKWKSTKP